MTKELIKKFRAAGMTVEIRQIKLAQNNEARQRWLRRLFRAATELKKLEDERKRLLSPRKSSDKKAADWTSDKYIGSGAGAVEDLDDDIQGI